MNKQMEILYNNSREFHTGTLQEEEETLDCEYVNLEDKLMNLLGYERFRDEVEDMLLEMEETAEKLGFEKGFEAAKELYK